MKKCPNCGKENSDNAKFCIDCGASLNDHNLRCPRCNAVTSANSKICPKCGYRFTSVSNCETQSINTIDIDVIDEEEYLKEQKEIKQRVFNSKIRRLNEDEYKNIKKAKIKEYSEDFASSKSKINAEKMLKVERVFHFTSFIFSALILLLGSIFSFLPLIISNNGNSLVYPYTFLIDNWKNVVEGFSYGYFANGVAHGLAPILQFLFVLAFMICSITFFLIVLIQGLNKLNRHDIKNNYFVLVLIDLLICLASMISISLDVSVLMYSPTILIFVIVSLIYLALIGGYYIFKASVVKETILIIRRILLTVSSFLGIGALVLLSYRFIVTPTYNETIHTYLNELLISFSDSNNGLSFYLGFVGYFIYILCAIFISLSTLYSFRMIRKYNTYRLNNLIFTIFGFILSVLILVLFTLSTYYSNLDDVYTINLYPLLVVILEGVSLLISLVSFILLKDERIKDKDFDRLTLNKEEN